MFNFPRALNVAVVFSHLQLVRDLGYCPGPMGCIWKICPLSPSLNPLQPVVVVVVG